MDLYQLLTEYSSHVKDSDYKLTENYILRFFLPAICKIKLSKRRTNQEYVDAIGQLKKQDAAIYTQKASGYGE